MNITFKKANDTFASEETKESSIQFDQTESIMDLFEELNSMIGLDKVKDVIYEIYALIQVEKLRKEAELRIDSHSYHMLFKGNPGTGKTTVARIVAKMFQRMGVLSKGHFIEAERADLVGEYIGHTAQKTRELVKKAMGGILFVDEAYSLARGGEKDFGKEAIDCLVKLMEDKSDDLVIILAGYSNEMNFFLNTNPGLPSRFPIQIDFPDYSLDQLIQIAESMVKERDYALTELTIRKLKEMILDEKINEPIFSNARLIRNLIEKSIRHQAVRLMGRHTKLLKQDLMLLLPNDLISIASNDLKASNIIS
ncbi:AAA family ATPase [Paenibacillus shirakamiensis]|nr:AAA family ATPase [Paenibacillus shirakamiensis]